MKSLLVLVLVLSLTATAEARGRRSRSYSSAPCGPCAAAEIAKGMSPAIKAEVEKVDLHKVEEQLLAETNAARVRNGRKPLVIDRHLQRCARWHTIWMCRNRTMTHGSGVAENIAMGQGSAYEVVQSSWMNSSGHQANMLNSGYTKVGLAAYCTPNGTIYWCQQFSR